MGRNTSGMPWFRLMVMERCTMRYDSLVSQICSSLLQQSPSYSVERVRSPGALWVTLCLASLVMMTGCAGGSKTGEKKEKEPFIIERAEEKPTGLELAESDPDVKSIQLYLTTKGANSDYDTPSGVEVQFPVLSTGTADALQLEFDILGNANRPVSVYFYHADANWQRDLVPAEYLAVFHRDDILDFVPSRSTDIDYTHYSYQFPNDGISFLISGNYIVRVTEMGMENKVLFERPFFVTEQNTSLQLGIENLLIGQGGFTSVQPVVLFIPPPGIDGSIFDYKACFARNGRFEKTRCVDQPSLIQQPALRFYLTPEQAFEPVTADYFLDISAMRVGNRIAKIAFDEAPYTVTLEPDYARFPGDLLDPALYGQTVISESVVDYSDADVSAEYVHVNFSYVTESGGKIPDDLYVIGSFNGWQIDREKRLSWNEENEYYEISMLLKQGQYDYRYVSGTNRLPRGTVSRPENLYTALVYYNDIRLNSDRLLSMGGFLGR